MIRDTFLFQLHAFHGLSRDMNMILLFSHKKDNVRMKCRYRKKYC